MQEEQKGDNKAKPQKSLFFSHKEVNYDEDNDKEDSDSNKDFAVDDVDKISMG